MLPVKIIAYFEKRSELIHVGTLYLNGNRIAWLQFRDCSVFIVTGQLLPPPEFHVFLVNAVFELGSSSMSLCIHFFFQWILCTTAGLVAGVCCLKRWEHWIQTFTNQGAGACQAWLEACMWKSTLNLKPNNAVHLWWCGLGFFLAAFCLVFSNLI